MIKLLNLGCGPRYHDSWTNIDFIAAGPGVIEHNLLKGIPFNSSSFDVVYHSHVLEHFTKNDGHNFLKECYRVLKSGGIIRVAVPDLERIAKEYLACLDRAYRGEEEGYNYEWIKLELLDQMVRNKSGGEMLTYLFNKNIQNETYVFERIGDEGRDMRQKYFASVETLKSSESITSFNSSRRSLSVIRILKKIRREFIGFFLRKELSRLEKLKSETSIGSFRLGGEIHQWMYDKYSLRKLLVEVGFSDIQIKDAFTSNIANWNNYGLESKNGIIYKPDSLFVEAIKL